MIWIEGPLTERTAEYQETVRSDVRAAGDEVWPLADQLRWYQAFEADRLAGVALLGYHGELATEAAWNVVAVSRLIYEDRVGRERALCDLRIGGGACR